MIVRDETAADHDGIRALNRQAFGGDYEAELIDRLRAEELLRVSLVALDDDNVIGHILFSTLGVVVDGWTVKSAALAPLAVAPHKQRSGVGSTLVRAGLAALTGQGFEAVFVLGHASYYSRFGFSAALARKLRSPYAGESFMALELTADALRGSSGSVSYPDAFDPD